MVERICPICGCKIVINNNTIVVKPAIRGLFSKIMCSECKKFITENAK